LAFAYHHIQRLMVTGMLGVTAQIKPQVLCDWYLSIYVDAVEWVDEPETRVGPSTCPMTTLYWNFLAQHETTLASNPRTALMVKICNACCQTSAQIRAWAAEMLANLNALSTKRQTMMV
jgi:deoxyribodipyrimidine photolyase-related protein